MSLQLQPIFDQVVQHLKTQNRQSMDESGHSCRYLNDAGLKCAVGCLIAKEHYHPNFEGHCPDWVVSAANDNPTISKEIFNAVVASQQLTLETDQERALLSLLLRRLQSCHDNYKAEEWPEALQRCANEFNLKYES